MTAGLGGDERLAEFIAAGDDYNSIMFKALADLWRKPLRSICMSVCARIFGATRMMKGREQALIKEKYRGIRPAPGYPACPDHREKVDLFRVLKADAIGMALTESYAMTPASSVSGFTASGVAILYCGQTR